MFWWSKGLLAVLRSISSLGVERLVRMPGFKHEAFELDRRGEGVQPANLSGSVPRSYETALDKSLLPWTYWVTFPHTGPHLDRSTCSKMALEHRTKTTSQRYEKVGTYQQARHRRTVCCS